MVKSWFSPGSGEFQTVGTKMLLKRSEVQSGFWLVSFWFSLGLELGSHEGLDLVLASLGSSHGDTSPALLLSGSNSAETSALD